MPSSSKGDIEPPDEITTEAAKGFLAGAFKVAFPLPLYLLDIHRYTDDHDFLVWLRLHTRPFDPQPPASLLLRPDHATGI